MNDIKDIMSIVYNLHSKAVYKKTAAAIVKNETQVGVTPEKTSSKFTSKLLF